MAEHQTEDFCGPFAKGAGTGDADRTPAQPSKDGGGNDGLNYVRGVVGKSLVLNGVYPCIQGDSQGRGI